MIAVLLYVGTNDNVDNMVTDGFGKPESNWCTLKQLMVPITDTVWTINQFIPALGAKMLNITNPLTVLEPHPGL